MSNTINLEDWLVQKEAYASGTDSIDTSSGQSMTSDPTLSQTTASGDPSIANMPPSQMATPPKDNDEEDYHSDPKYPDMPEEKEHLDFEQWKKEFYKLSIKNDVQEMKQAISDVENRELDAYQKKFVKDNLSILQLREISNIEKATKEIRKLIKEDLDHNNPATSIADHLKATVDADPYLASIFVKLEGLYATKGEYHRKFIAALLGGVQVGSGGSTEDILYNEKDFTIRISTRMNSRFGDIYIGNWSLRTDDPERYLKAPELKRLEDGSPEEKDVLRRRIVMESIAETFKKRAFIINVVGKDGTVYTIGCDLATALTSGYTDGRLLVKSKKDAGTEAMIDDDGDIISLVELKVVFTKETGEMDENGKPAIKEMEFIERRQGQLFLTATLHTLKEASASFPGLVIKEIPYMGNPSDIKVLQNCVPSCSEVLMRQCS